MGFRAMKILILVVSSLPQPIASGVSPGSFLGGAAGTCHRSAFRFSGRDQPLLDCVRLAEKNYRRFDAAWTKISAPPLVSRRPLVGDVEVTESDRKSITSSAICMTRFHGRTAPGHSHNTRALDLIMSFRRNAVRANRGGTACRRGHPPGLLTRDPNSWSRTTMFSERRSLVKRIGGATILYRLVPQLRAAGRSFRDRIYWIDHRRHTYNKSPQWIRLYGAILGLLLVPSVIEDRDGCRRRLDADPRLRPAVVLPADHNDEAMERRISARRCSPRRDCSGVARLNSLLIKNTFHPEAPCTLISGDRSDGDQLATGSSQSRD